MGSSESPPLKRQRRDSTSITNLSDVNWRNAICDALGIDNTVTDDELQESLICLQKAGLNMPIDEEPEVPEAEPHYKHLHRIHCAGGSALTAQGNTYEDAPITKSTDGKDIHLSANILITDFDRYIQRNLGISFIVIHEYFCCHMSRGYCQFNPIEPTKEWRESLFVASEYLYGALLKLNTRDTPSKAIPVFATGTETPYWDFWAFYNRPILQMLPSLCDGIEKKHASVFSEYFCKAKLLDFESTEKLITTGNFTLQSLGYLFVSDTQALDASTGFV
ncbi:hypothetical protein F4801DRAFT_363616 [Xylaria longipes]|nr:hypothetical protein F4801DRAFT_363616 [Xylaria longipes]